MQLLRKNSQPQAEDEHYKKTRSMLISLGLQNYEKDFKKGLLTDDTLPLLTDRQAVGLDSFPLDVLHNSLFCFLVFSLPFICFKSVFFEMLEYLPDQGSSFLIA